MTSRSCRRLPRLAAPLAAMLLGCLVAAPVSAALYKWTDANGRVVYSDQPPPGDVKVETMSKAPPPSNPNAVKEMASKDAELKKRQQERADATAKGDKARVDQNVKRQFCQQGAAQLAGLQQTDRAIYRLNEKGEQVYLDEAGRKAEAERLAKMLRDQNCTPGAP